MEDVTVARNVYWPGDGNQSLTPVVTRALITYHPENVRGVFPDMEGRPFWLAVACNEMEVVQARLHAGVDHATLSSALANAVSNPDIVRLLLDAGADVHDNEDKALHVACLRGHLQAVVMLLEAGADANSIQDRMFHCIWQAESKGHHNIVDVLRHYGAVRRTPADLLGLRLPERARPRL